MNEDIPHAIVAICAIFKTRRVNDFKKHVISKEHLLLEVKEPRGSMAYFVYFGSGRDQYQREIVFL